MPSSTARAEEGGSHPENGGIPRAYRRQSLCSTPARLYSRASIEQHHFAGGGQVRDVTLESTTPSALFRRRPLARPTTAHLTGLRSLVRQLITPHFAGSVASSNSTTMRRRLCRSQCPRLLSVELQWLEQLLVFFPLQGRALTGADQAAQGDTDQPDDDEQGHRPSEMPHSESLGGVRHSDSVARNAPTRRLSMKAPRHGLIMARVSVQARLLEHSRDQQEAGGVQS